MTDKEILETYREMELRVVESMKKNLALHLAEEKKTGLNYPQWQAIKYQQLRKFRKQNEKIFSGSLGKMPKEIETQLRDEMKQGRTSELNKYKKLLGEGRIRSSKAVKDSFFQINDRKVNSLIEEIQGSVRTANSAALRMANDAYRDVIAKYSLYVTNGVATEKQAYDMAVKDFLARGLDCVVYKDGSRHNIADYTEMAIRTANQRAYMIGEGEFRKEIGRTLIRITHHNTSCPLCKPFENRVLIDDVYSGGTADDGDYMLLSQAMAEGLYHPRCRHGSATYFPEVQDIIDSYRDEPTPKVDDYGKHQQAHIDNMIQKYKRLSLGSICPENVQKYTERLNYWEEQRKLYADDVDIDSESGIINKKALYTYDDPLEEIFGDAEKSNPDEIIKITEEFKQMGVRLIRPKAEKLCYEPGLKHGKPGVVYLSKGASYGAWLHERQHAIDDFNDGWLGFRVFEEPEKCIQREKSAYSIEIQIARKAGRNDIAERLEELCQNEIKKYSRKY